MLGDVDMFIEHGALPYPGAMLDQPGRFVHAVRLFPSIRDATARAIAAREAALNG